MTVADRAYSYHISGPSGFRSIASAERQTSFVAVGELEFVALWQTVSDGQFADWPLVVARASMRLNGIRGPPSWLNKVNPDPI